MLAKVCSADGQGIEAYPVEVEVNVGWGDTKSAGGDRLYLGKPGEVKIWDATPRSPDSTAAVPTQ